MPKWRSFSKRDLYEVTPIFQLLITATETKREKKPRTKVMSTKSQVSKVNHRYLIIQVDATVNFWSFLVWPHGQLMEDNLKGTCSQQCRCTSTSRVGNSAQGSSFLTSVRPGPQTEGRARDCMPL